MSALISVPQDVNHLVVPEICFCQTQDGGLSDLMTFMCIPRRPSKTRRFGVGARVACAVGDDTELWTAWAAGTVLDVDYSVKEDAEVALPKRNWDGQAALVPYRVELDAGRKVLVHRDEHWLIRDLQLQPVGPRQGADGTRRLARMEKRRNGDDQWEVVDHKTLRVRPAAPDSEDDD